MEKALLFSVLVACGNSVQKPAASKHTVLASRAAVASASLIDVQTGELTDAAVSVDVSTLSDALASTLRDAETQLIQTMALQNSDSYSVRSEIFADRAQTLFGVWAGAPGDIGTASAYYFNAEGWFDHAEHESILLTEEGQLQVDHALAAIDISTGEVSTGHVFEIEWHDGFASANGLPEASSANSWVENGFDYMHLQNSDGYSITTTVAEVNGLILVWVGAPGDIGYARVVVLSGDAVLGFSEQR